MENKEIYYGIWIPRQGYLRSDSGSGAKVMAFADKDVAVEVAHLYGQGSRVRFVDNSIVAIEADILARELKRFSFIDRITKIWHS